MNEKQFLKFVMDHHQSAINMAEIALLKKIPKEISIASENIIDDKTSEIELMQEWLLEWYGEHYQPSVMTNHLPMIESMENFEGFEFETIFLEKMADHYRELLEALAGIDFESFKPELKEFIALVKANQRLEIHNLNRLLKVRA